MGLIRNLMTLRQNLTRILSNPEMDNNFINLADAVDAVTTSNAGKSPLAGPGSGQAFSIGPLTSAGGINITNTGSLTYSAETAQAQINNYRTGNLEFVNRTAGNGIVFYTGAVNLAATLDYAGNLLVGVTSGGCHMFTKPLVGNDIGGAEFGGTNATFYKTSGWGVSSPNSTFKVGKDGITSRSISAGGTINASGADYAEYERKSFACGMIEKGQIVGFNTVGEVVDKWPEAVSFGLKSTNPNLVGGDTWGNEAEVGKKPEEPLYQGPLYKGSSGPGSEPLEPLLQTPVAPEQQGGEMDLVFASRVAWRQQMNQVAQTDHADALVRYREDLSTWKAACAQFEADQETHAIATSQAETDHAEALQQFRAALADFEARLELARQTVDRIAYSGKVPCNVAGALVGDYIVAAGDGENIVGIPVTDPTFEQYRRAVGRVRCILPDGRPEVAVIIH